MKRPSLPPACEADAQGTLEYALTIVALMAAVAGIAALWRAGAEGALVDLAIEASSHALEGDGVVDISLY